MSLQFCAFHVGSLYLGIETRLVQEVLRLQELTEVPLADPALRGLINLRGHIVPVLDLRTRLGVTAADGVTPAINLLVRTAQGPVGLLVDRVEDVQDVSADDFESPPLTLHGPARRLLRGAYKLKEGLLLSLDVDRTVDLSAH